MYWQARALSFWCWDGWVVYLILVGCLCIGTAGCRRTGPLPPGVPQAILALIMGAVFLLRYLLLVVGTPKHLAASPNWLQIQPRWAAPTRVRWEAIRVARHTGKRSQDKRQWVLACPEGDVIIKMGLLRNSAWRELSAIIHDEVSKRGRAVYDDQIETIASTPEGLEDKDP